MVNGDAFTKWVNERTIEYCDAVENLLEPELEKCLSLPERTDLIYAVINLGRSYMKEAVAKSSEYLTNRVIAYLKDKRGVMNE